MRYVYAGVGELEGQECDPILDERGKCVTGPVGALVRFADGSVWIVSRHRLRLAEKRLEVAA